MDVKPVLGRPKDNHKSEAILHAAKALFLQLGYDGSSMDKIAKQAGVSKLTVYNHFTDKETLFAAAIDKFSEEAIPFEEFDLQAEQDFITALAHVGTLAIQTVYRPEALKLYVLLLNSSSSNPDLSRRFFNASHLKLQQQLIYFFQRAFEQGRLHQSDAEHCCETFLAILLGVRYHHVLFQMKEIPNAVQQAAIVQQAVQVIYALFVTPDHAQGSSSHHCSK